MKLFRHKFEEFEHIMKKFDPYDIKTWTGFKEFKYIMDHIEVGSRVIVSDSLNLANNDNLRECLVTDIIPCSLQSGDDVDAICQVCVGEIALDDEKPDCHNHDSRWSYTISSYIRKIVEFEEIEFIETDEMKL